MDKSVDVISASFAISSLIDVGIAVLVIGLIGAFLWNKGRVTILPKR